MYVVSQQLDHFIVRFSPAWDLATKGSKTFTKACGSISSPKRGIRNEVFTQGLKYRGLENFPALTLQPFILPVSQKYFQHPAFISVQFWRLWLLLVIPQA